MPECCIFMVFLQYNLNYNKIQSNLIQEVQQHNNVRYASSSFQLATGGSSVLFCCRHFQISILEQIILNRLFLFPIYYHHSELLEPNSSLADASSKIYAQFLGGRKLPISLGHCIFKVLSFFFFFEQSEMQLFQH